MTPVPRYAGFHLHLLIASPFTYVCCLTIGLVAKKRVELNLTPLIRKQRGVFTKTGSGRRWVTDGGQIFPCQVTKQSTKCPDGKVTATTCFAFV